MDIKPKTEVSCVINKVTNDWARGRATGVVTMFKPDLKEVYYEKWLELDKGVK